MYRAHLTDPKLHDPANFIYVVCGIIDYKALSEAHSVDVFDKNAVHLALQKVRNFRDFYSASLVGKLDSSRAKETLDWSNGELSQLATFGNLGLIIKPEDTDVWVAWNSDIGTPGCKEERIPFVQKHKGKRKSVYDLMTDALKVSNPSVSYNELVIQGNPNVDITGLFYKTPCRSKLERQIKTVSQIVMDALKEELPIIEIPEPVNAKEYDEDPKIREQEKHLDSLRDSIALSQALLKFKKGDF